VLLSLPSNSFRIGCPVGTCRNTSRTTPIQTDLNSYASLPLCLSHAYSNFQLSDLAEGLCYLHSCNVIHGNLKGVCGCSKSRCTTVLTLSQPNILVDDSGHARIAGFGLATVIQNLDSIRSASTPYSHITRWVAPEVLMEGNYSKDADIFSFAMIMFEVRHG